MSQANPTDIVNVIKLLERLRTGEMQLIPGNGAARHDASIEMLQRVEACLSDGLRKMQEPAGDGGPAFPLKEPLTSDSEGMTLRDYFAAMAMQGSLASCAPDQDVTPRLMAKWSYELADAMLKARAA